ncbi:hypothetical protein AB5I41_00590 [Sphingomonas sp. MMS24-JH45]
MPLADEEADMDDDRVWAFEESLWTGDAAHYRELIDERCVMVVPQPPFVLESDAAVAAVSDTPRWSKVTFSDTHVARPQEGLIVVGYKAEAEREGERRLCRRAHVHLPAAGARGLEGGAAPADAAAGWRGGSAGQGVSARS